MEDYTKETVIANQTIGIGKTKYAKLLKGLIHPYQKIQNRFLEKQTTNARKNKYRKYVKNVVDIIFDYAPSEEINGIRKNDGDNYDVHHITPVREQENYPEKMTDFDNFAVVSKEDHQQADINNHLKNGRKVESVAHKKKSIERKEKLRICAITLFDAFFTAFFVGFLSEFIYGFFHRIVFEKEKINGKFIGFNLRRSGMIGLRMLLFSLPMSAIFITLTVLIETKNIVNIVQVSFFALLFLLQLYFVFCNTFIKEKNAKVAIKTTILFFVKGIILFFIFGISELIECKSDSILLQFTLSLLYTFTISILINFVIDLWKVIQMKTSHLKWKHEER